MCQRDELSSESGFNLTVGDTVDRSGHLSPSVSAYSHGSPPATRISPHSTTAEDAPLSVSPMNSLSEESCQERVSAGHSAVSMATPASVESGFLLNSGSLQPSNGSSCGSAMSSSVQSFCLPPTSFLPSSRAPQSSHRPEHILTSNDAGDSSSFSHTSISLPPPNGTLVGGDRVPGLVFEMSSPLSTLPMPARQVTRKPSMASVKSPITSILPASKCPPSLATQAETALHSDIPFSHPSPPRVVQSGGQVGLMTLPVAKCLSSGWPQEGDAALTSPSALSVTLAHASLRRMPQDGNLPQDQAPNVYTGDACCDALSGNHQPSCRQHQSIADSTICGIYPAPQYNEERCPPSCDSVGYRLRSNTEAITLDPNLLTRLSTNNNLDLIHSVRPGTPAKKSKPQSKLTAHVLTKGYLSTAKGMKDDTFVTSSSQPNVTTVPNAAFDQLTPATGRIATRSSKKMTHCDEEVGVSFTNRSPGLISEEDATDVPSQPQTAGIMSNQRAIVKLEPIMLPSLSSSTMELSTFLSTKSNPPPFSAFNRDETTEAISGGQTSEWKGTSGENVEEPMTDRFGFVVDAKYGMRLMRESRNKKKKNQHLGNVNQKMNLTPNASMQANPEAKEPHTLDMSSGSRMRSDEPNTEGTVPETVRCENTQLCLAMPATEEFNQPLEGVDAENELVATTALPIKSQIDVEAELASLRESLGLPIVANSPGGATLDDEASVKRGCMTKCTTIAAPKETANESIRRLLSQLNDMQDALERNQLVEWNHFIAKRRAKLMKTLMSNHHSAHSLSNASSTPMSTDHLNMMRHKTVRGSAPVSVESVGAFWGVSIGPRPGLESSGVGKMTSVTTGGANISQHSNGSAVTSQGLNEHDLMISHDENLIGIASMGLTNDHNKKSLKEDWKEFKALVMRGVPISLRPKIWLECSGANELKEPGYYHELLNKHKDEEGMALNQIECDVTR